MPKFTETGKEQTVKKLLSFLLILCIFAGLCTSAYAETAVSATVQTGGTNWKVSFTISGNDELAASEYTYTLYCNTQNSSSGASNMGSWSGTGSSNGVFVCNSLGQTDNQFFYYYFVVSSGGVSYTSNMTSCANPDYIPPATPSPSPSPTPSAAPTDDLASKVAVTNVSLGLGSSESKQALSVASGYSLTDVTAVSGLPAGISAAKVGDTVVLSGKPTKAGNFTVSLTVTVKNNSTGQSGSITKSLTATVAQGTLKITKSPGGETVNVGGEALFIAAAENYSKVEWRICPADMSVCWRGKSEIEGKFSGVSFSSFLGADGREYMKLSNIPSSLNGYLLQVKFWSQDGNSYALTDTCRITVNQLSLSAPVISAQPSGSTAEVGTPVTLKVGATAASGGLTYQWYSNTTASTTGGTKISGATSSSYTVPEKQGTTYYYCTVQAVNGSVTSSTTVSATAAVTYTAAQVTVTPTPVPETQQPVAETPAPESPTVIEETPAPVQSQQPQTTNDGGGTTAMSTSRSILLYVLVGLMVAILIAIIVLVIKLIRTAEDEDEAEDEDSDIQFDEPKPRKQKKNR